MIFVINRIWIGLASGLVLALAVSVQAAPSHVARSDILLHIVIQCVDPAKVNYCANCLLPRLDSGCEGGVECKKTNEVWALNARYVAIRDIKMCGCPAGFVHGLAMPRDVITGVEDANREGDIWQFAWDIGLEKIESESLTLVVNPKSERTQNQLHVHILRLDQSARAKLTSQDHAYIQNLDQVWNVAQKIADSKGLKDYGILAASDSSERFIVVVTTYSPESTFTVWRCSD